MSIRKRYFVWQRRLNESCSIMFQPDHMITLASKRKRLLSRWNKYMNRMFRNSMFDNLNRRYHVTISRNDDSDIATF